ncbi:MAG: MinD/ParA family protein [Thermodesulfobacteriota bacterium]|nr:MinD/ParA family protein [Thermodesulfobacteriota bacterium]
MQKIQHPITLGITSGKGGVGKTSLAVNISFALVQKGLRVLVVDGDLGLANVDVLLGLSVKSTIRDVLIGEMDPLESVIYPEQNLGVLPASSGVPEMVTLGPEEKYELGEFLTSISDHFDYIIMDTAAGIGSSVLWFNTFVNHNIVILSPDPTSLTDAYVLIKILSANYHRNDFYIVTNLVGSEDEGLQIYNNLERVVQRFLNLNLHYFGAVPEDDMVSMAVRKQQPFVRLVPDGKAAQAVYTLADRVRMFERNH